MDPEEIEFLAEKEFVSIVPGFNHAVIHLVAGDIGPFRAGIPINVPLWMAVNLKQQQRCKVIAPDWMDVDGLENIKESEKTSRTFTPMPSEHYMGITKLLLACASDDIPRCDEIRTIIKDIWDIRMSKLRSSIDILIKGSGSYAAVDHLTPLEINSVRPILPHALDQLYRMKKTARLASSQSLNTTTGSSASHSRFSITPLQ